MTTADVRNDPERCARALAPNLGRVQPDVELRDMEPEDLDTTPKIRQRAVGDAAAAVRAQATVDDVQVGSELVRTSVPTIAEPPPDERKLSPVRLALVLSADLRRVLRELCLVPCNRLEQFVGDGHQRARNPDRRGQRAHLDAVAT